MPGATPADRSGFGDPLHYAWWTDARCGEHRRRVSAHIGAQSVALTVESHVDRLHLMEVAHEFGPRSLHSRGIEPPLKVDLEAQGHEAGDDVPARRVVPVMIDWPHLECMLRFSKRALYTPQALVRQSDLFCGQVGAGAENKLPVEPLVTLDALRSMVTASLSILRKRAKPLLPMTDFGPYASASSSFGVPSVSWFSTDPTVPHRSERGRRSSIRGVEIGQLAYPLPARPPSARPVSSRRYAPNDPATVRWLDT